jgi:hypothetical protein
MEWQWNDIDKGKPKYSKKNLSQCHFVHQKAIPTALGMNPGLHGEKLETNCLSYGTAMHKL